MSTHNILNHLNKITALYVVLLTTLMSTHNILNHLIKITALYVVLLTTLMSIHNLNYLTYFTLYIAQILKS